MALQIQPKSGAAWKTFEEIQGSLPEFKKQGELRRRTLGYFLGPLLFLLCLVLPLPLSFKANVALGITAWTMVWWICEPIPIPATSIMACGLYMLLQVLPVNVVLPILGHANTWYLMATFIFMNAMVKHGFATRVAFWLLAMPIGRKSPFALVSLYIFSIAFISAWLSNMATTMLFLAIAAGMIEALKIDDEHLMSQAMRQGAAYGSQVGGFATPMGAAGTNFLAIGLISSLCGYNFGIAQWMYFGFPFMLVMYVVMIAYFKVMFKIELPNYEKACDYAEKQLKELGPLSKGEIRSVAITALVVALWIFPDIIGFIYGRGSDTYTAIKTLLDNAPVAILGASLCFIVPIDWKERKFVMNWTEANKFVDWGALILVVAGLVMGQALANKEVGILKWVTESVGGVLSDVPTYVAVLGLTALAVILTQIVPNLPAIAIILPVGASIATAIGLNPIAICLTLAIAAQQSYALPVAAPQMAFVYGAGGISMTDFIKRGIFLSIIAIPLTAFIVYFLTSNFFPV
ncbi:MAG: SLC13 family permease [Peptococcaceae bacterium]